MSYSLLSLEDLDQTPEVVEDATSFIDAPEQDQLGADEAASELAAIDSSIDNGMVAVDALEQTADAITATTADGGEGMTEDEIKACTPAVEALVMMLTKTKARQPIVASFEGFKDPKNKAAQRKATLEAAEDTRNWARKIWDSIKKAFSEAYNWVKKFLANLFDVSKKYGERAKKLKAEATKLKAAGKKSDTGKELNSALFKAGNTVVGGFYKALSIDRKFPDAGFAGKFDSASVYATNYLAEVSSYLVKSIDIMDKKENLVDEKAFMHATEEQIKACTSYLDSSNMKSTNKGITAPEGMDVKEQNLEFGDKSLYAFIPKSGATAEQWPVLLGKVKVFVQQRGTPSTGDITSTKIKPMSLDDVEKVCDSVTRNMLNLEKDKGSVEALDKMQKAISAITTQNTEGAGGKIARHFQGISRSLVGMFTTGASSIRSYSLGINKAALDYSAVCLRNASGAAAAAPAA